MAKHEKRASGGKTDKDKDDAFKRGGATKRKNEPEKRARGGRTSSAFSSAHGPSSRPGKSKSGHEGERGGL